VEDLAVTLGIPQLIMLALVLLNTGICLSKFGEPKKDRYDINDLVTGPAITLGLLWWGGFFG
jgi:hypothetical protein